MNPVATSCFSVPLGQMEFLRQLTDFEFASGQADTHTFFLKVLGVGK